MNEIETLIFVLEMVGIAAFAVSGVMVAAARELDVLGALVLGAVTSVGGGVIRDILLGALPPAMFVDPRYVAAAVGVSLVTFIVALCLDERFLQRLERLGPLINALDAVGSQLSRNHYLIRRDFDKVLRHKNSLLKDEASPLLLESLNDLMVTCGAQLVCYRAALFGKLGLPQLGAVGCGVATALCYRIMGLTQAQ